MSKMKAYFVFLNGEEVDTVFYSIGYTNDEVRRSLIDHDGYDPNISVISEEFVNKLKKRVRSRLKNQHLKQLSKST